MALPATDTFTTGTDQSLTAYSANWTANSGAFAVTASTDTVRADGGGGEDMAHWNADTFDANQYAQVSITSVDSSYIGVAVRCHASAATGYGLYAGVTESYLYKIVSGTWTQIGSAGGAWSNSDVLRLEVSGTTLTPKRNGSTYSTIGAQTDSSISSGYAGLSGYEVSGGTGDNWEGGNLSSSGNPSVSDSTAVSETVTLLVPQLYRSVSDSATVTDTPSLSVPTEGAVVISVTDSVAVTDAPSLKRDSSAPLYIAHATNSATTASTSCTINKPAGVAAGDLLIAAIAWESAGPSVTPPSGWQQIYTETIGTRTHTQRTYWYRLTSADDSTSNWTWTVVTGYEWAGMIVGYFNADDPVTSAVSDVNTSSASASAPTVTTARANARVVHVASNMYGTTWTAPTSPQAYTERVDLRSGTGTSNISITLSDSLYTAAGATGTVTATAGNADYYAAGQIVLEYRSPQVTTSDSAIVSEAVALSVSITTEYGLSASDSAAVAETVTLLVPQLYIGVTDSTTVTDTATVALPGDTLAVSVSDAAAVSDYPTVTSPGYTWERFEYDPAFWSLTQVTSGAGSTVTRSSAQAYAGTYSALCSTTNSSATAALRDADYSSSWSSVPSSTAEYTWQRARLYVPSATASAITTTEYIDLAGIYPSSSGNGFYLRLLENAELAFVGHTNGANHVYEVSATLPTDQWVEVEIGLWSQNTGDLDRAFAFLINGVFYGWFTRGTSGTNYDRLEMGIVRTNSADDLTVYVDDWCLRSTASTPSGTDNRPTGTLYTKSFTDQSGENVGFHYSTWETQNTLDATYGLYAESRLQSGVNHERMPDLSGGWAQVVIEWVGGVTPPWPPEGVGEFFGPMIGFRKSVAFEENLEIVPVYQGSTVDLVYESWTLSAVQYATWQLPVDHTSGQRIPGRNDIIRVRWLEDTPNTTLRVIADYYDSSAATWYLGVIDDTRNMTNVSGVNFTADTHAAVTLTIDSDDYSIVSQTLGTLDSFTPLIRVSEAVTVTDAPTVSISVTGALDVNVSDAAVAADTPTVAVPALGGVAVSDSAAVSDSPAAAVSAPQASVSDSTAVSDAATVATGAPQVNVADSATASETTTVAVSDPQVSVTDVTAAADSATVVRQLEGQYYVNVADAVVATDTVAALLPSLPVGVSDAVVATDAPTTLVANLSIAASDTVVATDAATVNLPALGATDVSVSDATAATDTASLTVSAPQVSVVEAVTVGETVSVSIGTAGAISITVTETVIVTETVFGVTGAALASVTETVTIAETVTLDVGRALSVGDVVTVTDTPLLSAPLSVSVADAVAAGETVGHFFDLWNLTASDAVAVTDTPQMGVNAYFLGIADAVAVADAVWLFVGSIVTPDGRTFAIAQDDRTFAVEWDDRTFAVAYEDRTYTIGEG
jgi:hypothetical protein